MFAGGYAAASCGRSVAGDARAIADTGAAEVSQADRGQQERTAADRSAHAAIDRATTQAAVALAEAARAGEQADSLRNVALELVGRTVADSAQRDSLTRAITAADRERRRQADSLQVANAALLFRAQTAERRWAAADSAANDLQGKLHAAQERVERLARMARRCRLGAAGPLVLSRHGVDAGVGAGVSCRL